MTDDSAGGLSPVAHPILPRAIVLLACAAIVAIGGMWLAISDPASCGTWIDGPQAWPDLLEMQEQARAACGERR